MSKYFMKNNEKSARSHPRLRKNLGADSSHEQQQQQHGCLYQKVHLGHRSGML